MPLSIGVSHLKSLYVRSLQVLRNDSTSPEKEPWEQFLLPNPHTDRLKFYNSVVRQIYESAFCSKQAGVKQYLLEQLQMRWQLNTIIEDLSKRENDLLRNEKWGVCQNITKFIASPLWRRPYSKNL